MTCRLDAVCFDANEPAALARFWAAVLGWPSSDVGVRGSEGFGLRFRQTSAPKAGPNQLHFDLTSASTDDQQATVDRALALGGQHLDLGLGPDDHHVVLADPEGNEFCVIEPENSFLVDTGTIGALSCDGTRAVGHFWSAALDWPLVWDQDEETAIQSPDGGTKISWGGPPVRPKLGRNRVTLELVAADVPVETVRLLALGATRVSEGVLADPDGNELFLRAEQSSGPWTYAG